MPRKPGQPRKDIRLPGLPRRSIPAVTFDATRCLKCGNPFPSVDPKTNRICAGCAETNCKLSRRESMRAVSLPPGTVLPTDGE